jgi:hypothetical protein
MRTKSKEGEQYAERRCRNGEGVDGDDVGQMIIRECSRVCDGGFRYRVRYLRTVVSDAVCPSSASSDWTCGTPQPGLSRDIRRISFRRSASVFRRPTLPLRGFHRQNNLTPDVASGPRCPVARSTRPNANLPRVGQNGPEDPVALAKPWPLRPLPYNGKLRGQRLRGSMRGR